MINIVLHGPTSCQLLFAPFCLLWEHMLVWDILHQTGQLTVPQPQCLTPKTSDQSFRYPRIRMFPQWITHSGPALITPTPFSLPPPPFFGMHLLFSAWEPEAALCVSQMKHLTSLLGVFYFSHCCRKLSVKCASGAAVCSSTGLLWGTGHADCPYGASTHIVCMQATLTHNWDWVWDFVTALETVRIGL